MGNILALDLSTKSSGWACYDAEGKLAYGVIVSSAADVEKRISIMRNEVIKLIDKYDINEVVMEEVRPDGMNIRTGKVLTWLQGCIAIAIYEYNNRIKVNLIGPSSWRSKLGIQGYRVKREEQKQIDIEYANKTFNLTLSKDMDDEADALCILASCGKEEINDKVTFKNKAIGSEESAF